jgi:hypothetical protein
VLGGLGNSGPNSAEVVDPVRENAEPVRGNHDRSIGFDKDRRCSPRFRAMAGETRRYAKSVLNDERRE